MSEEHYILDPDYSDDSDYSDYSDRQVRFYPNEELEKALKKVNEQLSSIGCFTESDIAKLLQQALEEDD